MPDQNDTPADAPADATPPATPKVQGRPKDDPDPGAVFVRPCPACGEIVQTKDGSGKTPCMVCKDLKLDAPSLVGTGERVERRAPGEEVVVGTTAGEPDVTVSRAAVRKR